MMSETTHATENTNRQTSGGLNHLVFWPPFLLLMVAVAVNLLSPPAFATAVKAMNDWVLNHFGWLFSVVAFAAVVLCAIICVSPFGKVRLGGADAKPLLHMWNWFAITICTTIAVGILLWSTAEPISHFAHPPAGRNLEPKSAESASFALTAMFLHWTFTPYSIYAVASLMFAFAYHNMKKPYSLGSSLTPLLGDRVTGSAGNLIDAVCLYSLVAGMAASLGSGILILAGGLNHLFPFIDGKSPFVSAAIAALVIATFVVSSATGLMKGIRILSSINTYALIGLALFVFFCGPTGEIIQTGFQSFLDYITGFVGLHFDPGSGQDIPEGVKSWSQSWTIFYWAVWLAWTPITACFLGQIAYGRTVREFMLVNFILPSLFGAAWMSIFGVSALHFEQAGAGFEELLAVDADGKQHVEEIAYALFEHLPLAFGLAVFYICSTFVCFVTSADSNTTAMAAISSTGITPENTEGGLKIKVAWGITVGLVAWVMITFADIEGIKMLSTLGGFPAAILVLLIMGSLAKVVFTYRRYDIATSDPSADA